jgi:hypothetical protein
MTNDSAQGSRITSAVVFRLVSLVLLFCGSLAAQSNFPVSFIALIESPLPDVTTGCMIVGDLNSDGKSDLVTCGNKNNIWVLLGNGDATFQPAATYTVGTTQPVFLWLADFNGDGTPDILVVNGDSTVSVLLNNGDGTFQPQVVTSVASANVLVAVAVGDFTGDGKADLAIPVAVPQNGESAPAVLIGNGDGTFQAPMMTGGATGSPQYGEVAVGDFNGDGKLDLAWETAVFLGNGNGTLQAPPPSNGARQGRSRAQKFQSDLGGSCCEIVADFNNDGKLDVEFYPSVYLGNGDGTFDQGHPIYGITGTVAAAGDFNGDGKLDLLVSDQELNNQIWLGNGDGTFQQPISGVIPGVPVAGDFNGDGILDVLGTGYGGNAVEVALGRGDGTFVEDTTKLMSYCNYYCEADAVYAADVNGDGKPDLIFATCCAGVEGGVDISVLLANGNGTFQNAGVTGGGSLNLDLAFADFNNDGKLDMAFVDGSALGIDLGNGDGTFRNQAPYGYGNVNPVFIATGDFNGDGNVDVVTLDSPGSIGLSIFLGNGDGTFGFPSNYDVYAASLVVGDFNHDGKLDLALNNGSIMFGNGDGTFGNPVSSFPPGASIAAADLNGDGNLDLVLTTSTGIEVMLGQGNGTFNQPENYPIGVSGEIAITDFNLDGKLDIAVGGVGATVLLGNGDGTFQMPAVYFFASSQSSSSSFVAYDVNGDGYPDVVTGSSAVLFNRPPAAEAWVSPGAVYFGIQGLRTRLPENVTYLNIGLDEMTIRGMQLSGPQASDFSFMNHCESAVAPGGRCFITVVFSPSASGMRTATLTITDSGSGSPHLVQLSGIGQGLGLGLAVGSSGTATISAGQTASYMLSIGGQGVGGNATLSCTGAPSGATCSLPSSINVMEQQATQFKVSVSTTGQAARLNSPRSRVKGWWLGFAMIGLLILPATSRSSRSKSRRLRWWAAGLAVCLILAICACGGGSGTSGGGGGNGGATPSGTYTLTVTGSAASGQGSVQVKLTVQ